MSTINAAHENRVEEEEGTGATHRTRGSIQSYMYIGTGAPRRTCGSIQCLGNGVPGMPNFLQETEQDNHALKN